MGSIIGSYMVITMNHEGLWVTPRQKNMKTEMELAIKLLHQQRNSGRVLITKVIFRLLHFRMQLKLDMLHGSSQYLSRISREDITVRDIK